MQFKSERDIDNRINQINQEINSLIKERNNLESSKQSKQLLKQIQKPEFFNDEYSWSNETTRLCTEIFNITSFRHNQLSIINSIMLKRNSLVIMPTGGGKSLCYQLPAIALPGLALVVSPLISLITDQVLCLSIFTLYRGIRDQGYWVILGVI